MTMRTMSAERVARHVQRAYDLGARYFFSQLPGPCFPQDTPDVWRAIERLFWAHQIPPRVEASAFVTEDEEQVPNIDDFAQMIGWRRLLV
jgi:hypothetical protein